MSKMMPLWIQGIFEEMSASQANNMLGQVARPDLKEKLKDKKLKDRIQKFLTDVINDAKLQFADEKPTMIWLIRQLLSPLGINILRLEEDKEQIIKDIIKFYKYKKELGLKLNEISYTKMKTELNKLLGDEGQQTLTDFLSKPNIKGNVYSLYILTDPKIASKIAEGTSWCTQNENTAAGYIEDYPLYVFYKGSSRVAQMHFTSMQFMDVNDDNLTPEVMNDIKSDIGKQIYDKIKDDTKVKIASYIFKDKIGTKDFNNIVKNIDYDEDIQKIISYSNIPEKDKYIYAYEMLVKKNTYENYVSFSIEEKGKIKIIIKDIIFFVDYFMEDRHSASKKDFIKTIIDGDNYYNYNDIDEYVFDYINDENKKTLFKYLKREGEFEEYEEDDIEEIPDKVFFRAIRNTDIYSVISGVYNDVENAAYNNEYYKEIIKAINNAGFIDNKDGTWYGYIPVDWAIQKSFGTTAPPVDCLFEGNYYDEEYVFSLHAPDFDNVYGYINENYFNKELKERLNNEIETDGEHKKRREKEEGQGMLFEEYMKRV